MKQAFLLILVVTFLLTACQTAQTSVTILADGQSYTTATSERVPAKLLSAAKITLGADDRVLYLGAPLSLDSTLPAANSHTLTVRRAVALTVITPETTQTIQTSALTVGQALAEAGYSLYAADRLDPPAETPLEAPLTVTYQPAREVVIAVDGTQVRMRSAAATVGQALAEAGVPLIGLDYSEPSEDKSLASEGQIRVVRVTENISLVQKSIQYETRTELSANLEIDQQELLQGGELGLAVTRQRTRSEDGIQVSQENEDESIVRTPQDRIIGYGTKIVIRTAVVDGITIEYYRALHMYATSYSPCRSATSDGRCLYGTSSGLPVQRGTVAMIYSWYLAFGYDPLYIPGYGYATVGDVGGSSAGNHYWVDLGWTDEEYQPMTGWMTVYFLTPVPKNLVYVLP